MTVTRDSIIEIVSGETGIPKSRSLEIVETLIEIIKKELESGDNVLFSGFGKFCVRAKKGRKGRNPYTGEDLMLAPRRVVIFKWSRKLRQKING